MQNTGTLSFRWRKIFTVHSFDFIPISMVYFEIQKCTFKNAPFETGETNISQFCQFDSTCGNMYYTGINKGTQGGWNYGKSFGTFRSRKSESTKMRI